MAVVGRTTRKTELAASRAANLLPEPLRKAAYEVVQESNLSDGVVEMMGRREFDSNLAAMLAGLGVHKPSRDHIDRRMEEMWTPREFRRLETDEIIVGAGFHAAVYSAVRTQLGFPKPLVLERNLRPGGAFAVSREPAFYMNSRNRPGPLSVPGDPLGSLNVLPGSPIQPADISGSEYMDNSSMGWLVRLNLAMYTRVIPGVEVVGVRRKSKTQYAYPLELVLRGEETDRVHMVRAKRVIVATSLDLPNTCITPSSRSDRILSFEDFMRRMDQPFPLRDMDRVAVIGAGDSGKTVIEALVGQGPSRQMSVASLDRPARIDWYGLGENTSRSSYIEKARPRYKGLCSVLPVKELDRSLVTPKNKAQFVTSGYNTATVDGKLYDYVIECVGYNKGPVPALPLLASCVMRGVYVGQVSLPGIYVVGPAANIPIVPGELGTAQNKENIVSLYRYAARTAALAASLAAP